MKTSSDPRHQKRIQQMQDLFAWDFKKEQPSPNIKEILDNLIKIDERITKSAPLWPIKQINKIDLAILRLATFEVIMKVTPTKVVVDEAVELAKEYGSQSSPSFVNGVLGNILENAK